MYDELVLLSFISVLGVLAGKKIYEEAVRYIEQKNMLETHNRFIRRAFCCMNCNRQMFPVEERYCCGVCEFHDYCKSCWGKAKETGALEDLHSHYLYHDFIFPEVDSSPIDNAISVSDALMTCFKIYKVRSLLGIRPVVNYEDDIEHEFGNDFTWITYEDTKNYSLSFGEGLLQLGVKQEAFIGLCGVSSPQWLLSQYGCFLKGLVPVPMHATFTANQINHIIKKTKLSVLIISKHLLSELCKIIIHKTSLKLIIFLDDYKCGYAIKKKCGDWKKFIELLRKTNIQIWEWKEIEYLGNQSKCKNEVYHSPNDSIGMLLSTSGSSGMPKLTVFTNERIRSNFHSSKPVADQMVVLSIEPMRQSMSMLSKGGRVGIYCGRLDKIMEDIRCLRPTVLGSTPSFWNNLYHEYQQDLLEYQIKYPNSNPDDYLEIYKQKHLFGNRLRMVLTGGAPLNSSIQDWLFLALGAFVLNGYGTTETGGISSNNNINPGVTLQLLDCPELNYTTSDLPYPRGEIVASTNNTISEYYNDEEKTEESFITIDGKRFFRTGDIGRFIDGKIEIIDRKKSMVKLSQGIFVAPEYLETLYNESNYIHQIFILGDSTWNCVAAVVVLSVIGKDLQIESNDKLTTSLRNSFKVIAKLHELQPWEIPQCIIFEEENFSVWNGLLTTIGKLCRPKLILKYHSIINSQIQGTQQETIILKKDENKNMEPYPNSGLCIGLQLLLKDVLCLQDNFSSSDSLLELGVDSLTLARLSSTIKKRFGSDIPLPALVKIPSLSILQTAIFSGMNAISDDLKDGVSLEYLKSEVEESMKLIMPIAPKKEEIEIKGILLTGANGFLGAFLLQSLLQDDLYENYTIFCLIRERNDNLAKDKLLSSLSFYEIELSEESLSRVSVFCGDVGKENFGLNLNNYQILIDNISIVFHNAALVNSYYNYKQHKHSNVIGVINILNFIIQTNKYCELHYISTVGMLGGTTLETLDVPLTQIHEKMGGYGQSKWVAEQIIHQFSDRYNCKTKIYRPSTIFSSSQTGASNSKDNFNRILCGLIKEKIYCDFIYDPPQNQSMLPGEVNLVPVDWVSSSIVKLSKIQENSNIVVYHLSNCHLIKMSEIIDYIKECNIDLKEVTLDTFKNTIIDIEDETHPFFLNKSTILHSGYATSIQKPETTITYSRLSEIPIISKEHFKKTIEFFKKHKLF